MHKYKVGDKVRFVNRDILGDDRPYVSVGVVYTVSEIGGFGMDLWVEVDHEIGEASFYLHEVEPA